MLRPNLCSTRPTRSMLDSGVPGGATSASTLIGRTSIPVSSLPLQSRPISGQPSYYFPQHEVQKKPIAQEGRPWPEARKRGPSARRTACFPCAWAARPARARRLRHRGRRILGHPLGDGLRAVLLAREPAPESASSVGESYSGAPRWSRTLLDRARTREASFLRSSSRLDWEQNGRNAAFGFGSNCPRKGGRAAPPIGAHAHDGLPVHTHD
jgi:hypothetical protein